MKPAVSIITLCLIISLAGCAGSPPPGRPYYAPGEVNKMTYCFGMSDTVMYAAREKLKQRPSVQLLDYYEFRPNAKLNIAIVKKVYADHFTSAWDYTVHTFNDCALRLAGVSAERVNLASYCEQNTLIADIAYAYKQYGYPRQQAYGQFSSFKGKTANQIVDRVYDGHESRAAIKMSVWNTCMAKIEHD